MFLRVLFLLLLALNLGVAGWLYFAPPPRAADFSLSDAGIPSLVLVAEEDSADAPDSGDSTESSAPADAGAPQEAAPADAASSV